MVAVEAYLKALYEIRSTGASVPETSYYPALANLLNAIGDQLKPKVHCILHVQNRGAGIPDGGLFTPDQFQKGGGDPIQGQIPSRGVIEVKPCKDDASVTADGEQVSKYWGKYRQVLVTNYREFILVGEGPDGKPAQLESYRLAASENEFWKQAAHPHAMATEHALAFTEYLQRCLLQAAGLAHPQDVAWFLASYARTAKFRVEQQPQLEALLNIRQAIETSLGMKFEGEKGDHFFRSTLVQTLFYGVFSAWVLWCRKNPIGTKNLFHWREAAWSLRVPMIRALFEQIASPAKLQKLGLVEVLDWTASALNRVDRAVFFTKFEDRHAVQYFYEPFLEAFDPELRKELGVWYTPPEIVTYSVERVDTVLREELGVVDGLANENVYVLDPCCGTGAYLVEVLRRIETTLKERGDDALLAQELKRAATQRVLGFELLPAPFVVAHLQLGLQLQSVGAPLSEQTDERVCVYLTNSLTGWEPPKDPKIKFLFPEMEEERKAADRLKREVPILVVLGNPPYNGFAGVALEEERGLSEAYRTTKTAPVPQGQGLNDLYVRFFRMAERRICEMNQPAKGVVCFISNYSWLDGLSFTGMRERYLEVFDKIWVDSLNGDKYETGKVTPEGEPDPSVFSSEHSRKGIQVGTAITILARKENHTPAKTVNFRNFWGRTKRADLLKAATQKTQKGYEKIKPVLAMGLPFKPSKTNAQYFKWPRLTDLFPVHFSGVKTSNDDFLVDIDRNQLQDRLSYYFDPEISHDEVRRLHPSIMENSGTYKAKIVRNQLLKRGLLKTNTVRYCYRPFDVRWLYWEPETKLLDGKRAGYFSHLTTMKLAFVTQQKPRRAWSPPQVISSLGCLDLMDRSATCFPLRLNATQLPKGLFETPSAVASGPVPNLSELAQSYLAGIKAEPEALFFHAIAVLHSPVYREENSGALRQDWPRIPLPATLKELIESAAKGRLLAALLDPETPVTGVTVAPLRAELKSIGVISRTGGGQLNPDAGDLALTARWGIKGQGGICMPSRGKSVSRAYTVEERKALEAGAAEQGLKPEDMFAALGESTFDLYLNETAYWRNVPQHVWEYSLGGYQVIKKWLSYREKTLLGRDLTSDEAREVTNMIRRIAAILTSA